MDASILIQGLSLAGVVGAMLGDLRAVERGARAGHARARKAGPEQRCPFCHGAFDPSDVKVRCASCATGHHAACWTEHPRCSVFGCGSEDLRERRTRASKRRRPRRPAPDLAEVADQAPDLAEVADQAPDLAEVADQALDLEAPPRAEVTEATPCG